MSYKLYVIILNEETGDEEVLPLGIVERDELEDANTIRDSINRKFGEINQTRKFGEINQTRH